MGFLKRRAGRGASMVRSGSVLLGAYGPHHRATRPSDHASWPVARSRLHLYPYGRCFLPAFKIITIFWPPYRARHRYILLTADQLALAEFDQDRTPGFLPEARLSSSLVPIEAHAHPRRPASSRSAGVSRSMASPGRSRMVAAPCAAARCRAKLPSPNAKANGRESHSAIAFVPRPCRSGAMATPCASAPARSM